MKVPAEIDKENAQASPVGDIVLITGAARGIGEAIAMKAATFGWRVALNYASNDDAAEAVASAINSRGGEVQLFKADISDDRAVKEMFEKIDTSMGRVNALINNAGIIGHSGSLMTLQSETLQRVFAVNTFGSFYCAREAALRMSISRGGKGGVILNVSSRASTMGGLPGEVHYAASKGAVDSMTKGMSIELGPEGIRVNALRPGPITTDIHDIHGGLDTIKGVGEKGPLGRCGSAEEVASAALWLISPAASYVNGAMLDVTGGL